VVLVSVNPWELTSPPTPLLLLRGENNSPLPYKGMGLGELGDFSNTLSDRELVIITLFKSPKVF
jgi:hypothetical protein